MIHVRYRHKICSFCDDMFGTHDAIAYGASLTHFQLSNECIVVTVNLAEWNFWGVSEEARIGFLCHSEIKHGRIAMFAFVGYIVHANGIKFPWPMQLDGTGFPDELNPPLLWDKIPEAAKWQIIGFLEYWIKLSTPEHTHYMMPGGKPGKYPDPAGASCWAWAGGRLPIYSIDKHSAADDDNDDNSIDKHDHGVVPPVATATVLGLSAPPPTPMRRCNDWRLADALQHLVDVYPERV